MDAERLARAMHNGWEGEPCPDPNCPDIDRWRADARNLIREYAALAAPAVTETAREVFRAADAFMDELDAPPGHPLSDHYHSQAEVRLRAAIEAYRAALATDTEEGS